MPRMENWLPAWAGTGPKVCLGHGFLGTGVLIIIATLAFVVANKAYAARNNTGISDLCDRAAIDAARSSGVPLNVLRSISRAESGRSSGGGLQPWPWTVNMEGTGRWFESLDEARSYVFLHFKNGARSFDVGCFQINYKWHGEAFRSIDDMLDPLLNARYAAEYLSELYQEFGNWTDAVGAYHSRTPELAERYTARFEQIKVGLSEYAGQSPPTANSRWLGFGAVGREAVLTAGSRSLVVGGASSLGSLVPIAQQSGAGSRPFVILK
jgi:Transglycosylase SLT domain